MAGDGIGDKVARGANKVAQGSREAADHPILEWGARLGYVVNGILHLVIGWLALQLAFGRAGATADQSGVFGTLSNSGLGKALLVAMLVGFALLAIWQTVEAIGGSDTGRRVKAGAKGVMYFALAFGVFGFLRGTGSSSSGQSVDFTARLMSAPGGRLLVGAVGLGVLIVGAYHIVKGIRKKFLEDLTTNDPGRAAELAGQIGYIAKGVALSLIGVLFGLAALNHNPSEATGMDGGMRQLLELPFGKWLLVAVAIGFILFAGYYVVRARFAKV